MTANIIVRSRLRPLVGPAITTAIMLAILLALGVWQLERREWKLGLLAQIDRAEASPPVPLSAQPRPFTTVSVAGSFRQDLHALYGTDVRLNKLGSYLIEPLDRPGQETVLVNRGWVPEGTLGDAPAPGPVTGYVRFPVPPGAFTPADDTAALHFYTLDPAKIGAALGLTHVASFTLVQLGSGEGFPTAASALPRPPNDHLNYALTWFGLAGTLVVVFTAYARKVIRA